MPVIPYGDSESPSQARPAVSEGPNPLGRPGAGPLSHGTAVSLIAQLLQHCQCHWQCYSWPLGNHKEQAASKCACKQVEAHLYFMKMLRHCCLGT